MNAKLKTVVEHLSVIAIWITNQAGPDTGTAYLGTAFQRTCDVVVEECACLRLYSRSKILQLLTA